MTDDETLAAAIEASLKLAEQVEAFQTAQAVAAAIPKSAIGNVAFEALMRDSSNILHSKDQDALANAINQVKAVQRNNALTSDQDVRVDPLLIDLTRAISAVTHHAHLGAC
jgi:glutaredoxin 2